MTGPGGFPAVQPPDQLLYLDEHEMVVLLREAQGARNGRVVQCAFGPGGAWLDPATRDKHGHYPRWIMLRLAVLRSVHLLGAVTDPAEHDELVAFAAAHGVARVEWL